MCPVTHYRALHQIPELDKNLPKTLDYLKNALKLPTFSPTEGSLCAFLDQGAKTTLAFRSDMDALPIRETTGLPFASRHPGCMHACGHDGHMAILLALAARLKQEPRLPHNILLIFQPAEETTGGARELCRTGILEACRVAAIFGLHIWPGLPAGRIYSKKGPMMARSCQLEVEVTGPAAHITAPGPDALAAAARLQCRFRAQTQEYLLKFGSIQGGTAPNITAERVRLSGTLRSLCDGVFEERLGQLRGVKEISGCSVAVHASPGYPLVTNPPALCDRVAAIVPVETLETPVFLSEDFSWYQRRVPGQFFFLGAGAGPALHRPDFSFPEEILSQGVRLWYTLATRF